MSISAKQKAAADHYIKTGDKSKAIEAAGYRTGTDESFVFENNNVIRYINNKKGCIATVEDVMIFLTRVMQGLECEKETVTIKTGKDTTDIKKVDKPISVTNRLRAAELLIKWLNGTDEEDILPVVIKDDM